MLSQEQSFWPSCGWWTGEGGKERRRQPCYSISPLYPISNLKVTLNQKVSPTVTAFMQCSVAGIYFNHSCFCVTLLCLSLRRPELQACSKASHSAALATPPSVLMVYFHSVQPIPQCSLEQSRQASENGSIKKGFTCFYWIGGLVRQEWGSLLYLGRAHMS